MEVKKFNTHSQNTYPAGKWLLEVMPQVTKSQTGALSRDWLCLFKHINTILAVCIIPI